MSSILESMMAPLKPARRPLSDKLPRETETIQPKENT
jgi:hypothetical protein